VTPRRHRRSGRPPGLPTWQDSHSPQRTARQAGPPRPRLAATPMRHAAQIFRQGWSRRWRHRQPASATTLTRHNSGQLQHDQMRRSQTRTVVQAGLVCGSLRWREPALSLLRWYTAITGTGWLAMVRRRSTVRFRKVAPGQRAFPMSNSNLRARKVPLEWHSVQVSARDIEVLVQTIGTGSGSAVRNPSSEGALPAGTMPAGLSTGARLRRVSAEAVNKRSCGDISTVSDNGRTGQPR
jgi:hypothetical protein